MYSRILWFVVVTQYPWLVIDIKHVKQAHVVQGRSHSRKSRLSMLVHMNEAEAG